MSSEQARASAVATKEEERGRARWQEEILGQGRNEMKRGHRRGDSRSRLNAILVPWESRFTKSQRDVLSENDDGDGNDNGSIR